jgi:hypothetical protein
MQAEDGQLGIFKEILEEYTAITGLQVNYHKSSLVPINLNEGETNSFASFIGCTASTMPFTYLGLPMGTTKPTIKDLSPLTYRVERRLYAFASFLPYGDRLVLVNSILSSLPAHYLYMFSKYSRWCNCCY